MIFYLAEPKQHFQNRPSYTENGHEDDGMILDFDITTMSMNEANLMILKQPQPALHFYEHAYFRP